MSFATGEPESDEEWEEYDKGYREAMNAPTPDTSLGCEYCSGENDKPGWKGSYSDDGAIGYVACWNCNPNGLPSSADTSPGDEIEAILEVLCDDPSLLSTPEERGIAAVGYHNIAEAKDRLNRLMLTRERELSEKVFIDFPTGHELTKIALVHEEKCSSTEGMMCDCSVLKAAQYAVDKAKERVVAAIDAQLNKEEER